MSQMDKHISQINEEGLKFDVRELKKTNSPMEGSSKDKPPERLDPKFLQENFQIHDCDTACTFQDGDWVESEMKSNIMSQSFNPLASEMPLVRYHSQ